MKRIKLFAIMLVFVLCSILTTTVFAAEMSEDFKKILTDGKLIVKAYKPTNKENATLLLDLYLMDNYKGFSIDSTTFNSDFTSCELLYNTERHVVNIEYKYDEELKKIVDGYMEKILARNKKFEVDDLELVNFWINAKGDPEYLMNYSTELNKMIGYKNFTIRSRMGSGAEFEAMSAGFDITIDDTIYAMTSDPKIGTKSNHVLYVPSDTEETKEALIAAIQSRIDNAFGKGKVVIEAKDGQVIDYYLKPFNDSVDELQAQIDEILAMPAEEQDQSRLRNLQDNLNNYKVSKQNAVDSIENENGGLNFLKKAIGGYYFVAKVGDESHLFVLVKSDALVSKEIEHITSDLKTDVTVKMEDNLVPIDTQVKVERVTEGAEYNRIIKVLNVETSEMYDILLYSESKDTYVTELSNGMFEVRIPLSEKFEGKDLIVYYVDSNGKITAHSVTVRDGYAVFTTTHFSIYTLAVKPVKDDTPPTGVRNNDAIRAVSMLGIMALAGIVLLKNIKEED